MIRRFRAVLLASTLLIAPAAHADAQARFSVAGGLAVPTGELGDVTDLGYNVAAGINFGGTYRPIGVRLEGALNGFSFKEGEGDVRVLNGTANAVVNFSQQADSPFLIGGLGLYNSRFSGFGSENAVGVNLGGGLRFPLGGLTTFFEARYHAMLGNGRDGTDLKFVPITFGILF